MAIVVETPGTEGLTEAVAALRRWQSDDAPLQLHPGDLGWNYRFGAAATAAVVRTWTRDGRIVAVGLLDGPGLVRLTIAPDVRHDEELARQLAEDVSTPERDVLPAGPVSVEAPDGVLLRDVLAEAGWRADEPWTPLHRDLAEPVPEVDLRIEVTGPAEAAVWTTVLRASFDRSTATEDRWHTMAAGSPYADARSLIGYDGEDNAVAIVTVWSAGPGRPGLIEPMGVHRDHRGHGHGRAITVAAAAALRELGSSSAIVCTASANAAAVATYASAGFRPHPERLDLRRDR
ncbi:GNAT family N-acetyltransferase [Amycolatopsis sp. WQ 127309]|uniref:GNAT family N-acetyltransferase n=1 Tax=Amycolatopsis sp. WQ 127309 TaxID=2932773 RepID=UPI001FF1210D|nr:GNAT family N-acetyltransferase [Amycolatopsis sp. WQ 127309]UOZ05166.1 GNAT family N-acetyltransferase [Amycolatopsis sp. WQ 127309]